MWKLEEVLIPTQAELFSMLCEKYKGKVIFCKGNFILVKGDAPIMLVAHLDTVHEQAVKNICKTADGNILMSPQGIGGDDRCGVYALAKIYELSKVKPFLLFTCNEEIGGIGAQKFCTAHQQGKLPVELDNLKCIVEIDRKGKKDAVYYDCDNPDFEKYISSKGFQTDYGTFSDISVIAPELEIAAVNLSSGYYNAHTLHEYIKLNQLERTISKVIEIVADASQENFPKYVYSEYQKTFYLNRFSSFDEEEFEKKILLADLPKKYKKFYKDFFDYYTAEDIQEFKKNFDKQWAEFLYQDFLSMLAYEFDGEK